jgi:hypothetical protein
MKRICDRHSKYHYHIRKDSKLSLATTEFFLSHNLYFGKIPTKFNESVTQLGTPITITSIYVSLILVKVKSNTREDSWVNLGEL